MDFLIAEVSTLLEYAGQRDGLHYGLVTGQPIMYANGSFGFEASTVEAMGLLLKEHWTREFRDAAVDDGIGVDNGTKREGTDSEFEAAFIAEFGLSMEQYGKFVLRVALEALERKDAHLRMRRSEVWQRLRQAGAGKPKRVFRASDDSCNNAT